MNAIPSIPDPEPTGALRPSPMRAPSHHGATPFGAVMSSVTWSAMGGSKSSPQLAADEMFEPRADASTRRMNALRGDERLDAPDQPARQRARQKTAAQPEKASLPEHERPSPVAHEQAASPQVNQPSVPPPASLRLSAESRGRLNESHELSRRTAESSATVMHDGQPAVDAAVDAPAAFSPGSSPVRVAPRMNSEADSSTLARQVGRVLSEPRASGGSAPRNDASVGMARLDGPKNGAAGKDAASRLSQELPAEPPAPEAPADDAAPTRFDDLIRAIRIRAGDGHSTARLQLRPPRLGYMEVEVTLEGDQLHLDVRTESDEARRRVHEQAVQLKTALESAGIEVAQLHVSVDPDWLRDRGPSAHAWMGGGPHERAAEESRRSSWMRNREGTSGEDRLDFDRLGGVELSDVSAMALARGSRRIDLRV